MNSILFVALITKGETQTDWDSSSILNWKSNMVLLNERGFFCGMIFLGRFFLQLFLQKPQVIFNTKPGKTMKNNPNVVRAPFLHVICNPFMVKFTLWKYVIQWYYYVQRLCNNHHYLIPEHCITLKRNLTPTSSCYPFSNPFSQATTHPCSVFMNLPILDILYK